MAVLMAEAYWDEKKKAGYDGTKAGDNLQTVKDGKQDLTGEVRISNWRNEFTVVYRFKDRAMAKACAEAATFFANSSLVGYSQPNRLSLENKVKSLGYTNYKNLNKKVECDCSSLTKLCANIAGVKKLGNWNTSLMLTKMKTLDEFTELKDAKYTKSSDYLMVGDILLRQGHVAICISDGPKAAEADTVAKPKEEAKKETKKETTTNKTTTTTKKKTPVAAASKSNLVAAKYAVTASTLNMRLGPSTTYAIVTALKKDAIVTCYGYYTKDWYLVVDKVGNAGYVNKAYLKKK